jgi:putative ABC transport system ATP-binding protein
LGSEAIARAEGLTKVYRAQSGEVRALVEVSVTFAARGLTAVIGPSGSGKSSLLRVLAALERPTSGDLFIDGHSVMTASERDLRRIRRLLIRYMFGRPSDNFLPHLTIAEHLRLAAHSSHRELDIARALDALDIGHRADHLPRLLSGGEQQRAALAQVSVSGARLIVADEPTADLDSRSAEMVIAEMRRIAEERAAVIVATHDPSVIEQADNMIRLDHGAVVPQDSRWSPTGHPTRVSHHPAQPDRDIARAPAPWKHDDHATVSARGIMLTKRYEAGGRQIEAVSDVSVTIRAKELVGLMGRSGSGKTTLLNLLGGWEHPDQGDVILPDTPAPRTPPPWATVAMVPQKLGLMDELTIRENIEYPARLSGMLAAASATIDALVEILGLSSLQSRLPQEVSFGEQQRAALARSLVLHPRLLLADEPTSHQDRPWTVRVFEVIRQATAEGAACLAATHDPDALRWVDRVLEMSDGRIREIA